jgi:type I restriction enzyme R subunit
MPSKLNEASLEELIATQMTSAPGWEPRWRPGDPANFNAAHCLDLPELAAFLIATSGFNPAGSPTHLKFLTRLTTEVTNRGIVDVLRKGVGFNQHHVDLFFPTPSAANSKAAQLHAANRLAITRQVHYSVAQPGLSIDLVASVNGLPIATFEVKNLITHQNTDDAVRQYKRDRDPKEPLFKFGRCMAHFAVDDREVWFCAELKGKGSWFLPFNKGWKDGAGNPPNPDGVATDYLWRAVLAPSSLANIIENYAQVVTVKNLQTGAKVKSQIFPRYHQLDVVRKLLSDVVAQGSGHRYLIQHSAGSGKSNSIAWLAHQLMEAEHAGKRAFDSIIVVTDRVVLDGQIRDTIKNFMQVGSTVVHAESSSDLREAIEAGKKIIITTVQKFPYIVAGIGDDHRGKNFAIIIDEAHSSQGGKTAGALAEALSVAGAAGNEGVDVEDEINRLMEAKKMLPNASYFAFTATPKNKTLETFGEPYSEDGVVKHRPFHSYTMKQAIQEGFILDVLANYIPVAAYYKLVKTIDDDPEFDAKRASKKLRSYVEGQRDAIRLKAEIMVDHFQAQVIAKRKINGDARAMVVTASIDRAIKYYEAISA